MSKKKIIDFTTKLWDRAADLGERSYLKAELDKLKKHTKIYDAGQSYHDMRVSQTMDDNPGYKRILTGPKSRWSQSAIREGRTEKNEALFRQLEQDHDVVLDDNAVTELNELLDSIQAAQMYGKHSAKYAARSAEIEKRLQAVSKRLGIPVAALVAMVHSDEGDARMLDESGPEMQRIQHKYGLSEESMLDRYLQAQKYDQMTHKDSHGQDKPIAKDLTYDRWVRSLGHGVSQVPSDTIGIGTLLAPYSLPGMVNDVLGGDSEKSVKAVEDRTRRYWVDPQGYEAETPAEEIWNEAGRWMTPF